MSKQKNPTQKQKFDEIQKQNEKHNEMAKLIEESFILFKVFSKDNLESVKFSGISGNSVYYQVSLKISYVDFKDLLRIQLRGFGVYAIQTKENGNIAIEIEEHSTY